MTEKHGGIWLENSGKSLEVIRERYDIERDIIEAIYRRTADGFYTIALFVKDNDPHWGLPIWNDVARGSIFETVELAEAHLRTILMPH